MSDLNSDQVEREDTITLLAYMLENEAVFMEVKELESIQKLLTIHPDGGKFITIIQERLNAYYKLKNHIGES